MSTDFIETFKPFLTISKLCGFINVSYTLETGILSQDMGSWYRIFLELMRSCVLIVSTYHMAYSKKYILITHFNVVKYWSIFVTARIMEKHVVKFINGVIQFDRKMLIISSLVPTIRLKLLSKDFWNVIFTAFLVYYLLIRLYFLFYFVYPKSIFDVIINLWFHSPDIYVFTVTIMACFFLGNLGYRFCALNIMWTRLPSGLRSVPGGWENSNITCVAEQIRLLHSELSGLLRLFSFGYGPVILVLFIFSYLNAIMDMFIIIMFRDYSIELGFSPHIFVLQYAIYTLVILYITSWVIEEKIKIISILRLNRLIGMPVETKLQVKLFMNQVAAYDINELTAFGFFSIHLKTAISILVLMITGISALIQMKEHPLMQNLNYALFIPLQKLIVKHINDT